MHSALKCGAPYNFYVCNCISHLKISFLFLVNVHVGKRKHPGSHVSSGDYFAQEWLLGSFCFWGISFNFVTLVWRVV